MKPEALRVAVIGAGSRGTLFGELIAASGLARITAVAEPQRSYREQFAARHGVAAAATFRSWEQLCTAPAQWDAAVVTTLDQDHAAPAIACLRHGWHLLLEKPMATTLADCEAIAAAAAASGVVTSVCHSMRYGAPFRKLKQIVAGGRLRVITIDQLEQVGWAHQAHSFVRGRWGNEGRATFMLMAKSCHDVDCLAYLADAPCHAVSSFGALTYFRRDHARRQAASAAWPAPGSRSAATRHYATTSTPTARRGPPAPSPSTTAAPRTCRRSPTAPMAAACGRPTTTWWTTR